MFSYQPIDDPLLRSSVPEDRSIWKELFRPSYAYPTILSAKRTKYLIALLSKISETHWNSYINRIFLVVNGFLLCAIQIFAGHHLAAKNSGYVMIFIFFLITEILLIVAIARQPKIAKTSYFEVRIIILTKRHSFSLF